MPRAFSEPEKEIIRRRLLENAYRLFSAHGLQKTNVEEIALACGISKGAFYSFYESKEALFMDVIEQTEVRVRKELLQAIELPGPSPRARLAAVLKKAFDLFQALPVLQFFNGRDFDVLMRRVPAEQLQEHLASDQAFFTDLIARCQQVGIPIRAPVEQITGLLYLLVLATMHQGELGAVTFGGSTDTLIELIAAFCVGEVELQLSSAAQGREEAA
jgi:AcrR family transcriptional regulator